MKWLGITPATPYLGSLKAIPKKFRTVHMAEVLDCHSGTWPFIKGQCAEVTEPPEKWKDFHGDWMVWLKGKDGKPYGLSKRVVKFFDRQEEIK